MFRRFVVALEHTPPELRATDFARRRLQPWVRVSRVGLGAQIRGQHVIITISGRPGSGKSAVAIRVAAQLGLDHVSAGDFMREMAEERGMSILELSRSAERRDIIDEEIDARTARLASERDDFVMDARLGWHFIPDSIKVFLEVRPEVAAQRIYQAGRGTEHENVGLDETLAAIESRTRSERKRYLTYYDIDYTTHGHYDLVVDTSDKTIDQVTSEILDHVETRRQSG